MENSWFKKQKNIWTFFFDKNGELVGSMEEGLDTWWTCNLRNQEINYLKIWHRPKNNKLVDRKMYNGFQNRNVVAHIILTCF